MVGGGGGTRAVEQQLGSKDRGGIFFYGEPLKLKLMLHSNFITACFFKFEFFQSSILKKRIFCQIWFFSKMDNKKFDFNKSKQKKTFLIEATMR